MRETESMGGRNGGTAWEGAWVGGLDADGNN